jgi:hypothetical protein
MDTAALKERQAKNENKNETKWRLAHACREVEAGKG